MHCSCVILNYNDAETTVSLVRRIYNYRRIKHILVIDNCSTDDSREGFLQELPLPKVICLKTDRNGGYGYGNNFGVRYAHDVLGENTVLIVNPDVEFTEDCLDACLRVLSAREDTAIVSPLQLDTNGKLIRQFAWNLGSGLQHLLSCECILRHTIFPIPRADVDLEGEYAFVDCVPGSFLLVDGEKFLQSGGYHEQMFLYWEETLLGHRIRRMGWKTVLLPRQKYIHHHAVSVRKSIPKIVSQRQIQHESLLVCLMEMWQYGDIRLFLARSFLKWCLVEEKILSALKLMLSGRSGSYDQ